MIMVDKEVSSPAPFAERIRQWMEPLQKRIYGFDIGLAQEYLRDRVSHMTNLLHHPDTAQELQLLSTVSDPTPAFYRNVSVTETGKGLVVQFTEPTYKHTDEQGHVARYYGMNISITFDDAMRVLEIQAQDRTGEAHVVWNRTQDGEQSSWRAQITSLPRGTVDSQRFATDFFLETNAAVFTFIDRLGTTKDDTENFRRSSVRDHLRDDVADRQSVSSREWFLFHALKTRGVTVAAGVAGFVNPVLTTALAFGIKQIAPESKTANNVLASAVGGALTRFLTSCAERPEIPAGGTFTIVDLTEQTPVVRPFEPNPAVPMIPETDMNRYKIAINAMIDDPMDPHYLGTRFGYSDPRSFNLFVQRTDLKFITNNVLIWLSNGEASSTNPVAWEPITRGNAFGTHAQMIQHVSAQGISGDMKLLGYFYLNQHRGTNIMRQGLVVEYQGAQYVMKIQPFKAAMQETTALTRLQQIDPQILVADESVFKRVFSSRSKLTITISDMILVPANDGGAVTMAPTIESFLLSGKPLSEVQLTQLSRIYQAMLTSHLTASLDRPMLGADILKPANIAVNSQGNLVVVDGYSSAVPSFATINNGKLVVTQSDPLKHLFEAKNMLKRLGLTDAQLGAIETQVFEEYARIVAAGDSATVDLVESVSQKATAVATVTNDTPEPIVVPKQMTMPRWMNAFGMTLNVLFGAWVGKSIYDFALPFDASQETVQEPASLYARRGLDIDLYLQIANDEPLAPPYTEMLRAHALNSVSLESIRLNMESFRAAQDMRMTMNLATYKALEDQVYARQLHMTQVGVAAPERDETLAWIIPDGNTYGVFVKQPMVQDGESVLYLEPTIVDLEGASQRDTEHVRAAVIGFDITLSQTIASVLSGATHASTVFSALQAAVNAGTIDFYTVTGQGYLVYGYATQNGIEFRYAATTDSYNENSVLRAVSLRELMA
jgi:hypothetical protein